MALSFPQGGILQPPGDDVLDHGSASEGEDHAGVDGQAAEVDIVLEAGGDAHIRHGSEDTISCSREVSTQVYLPSRKRATLRASWARAPSRA